MKPQRVSRCIALFFLQTRREIGEGGPIVQEAGWALEPVWAGAGNLVPTGIRSRTIQPVRSRYIGEYCWPTLMTGT